MNRTQYLLVKLAEECAEVAHACSKSAIFGLTDINPKTGMVNRDRLSSELTDLLAVADMLRVEGSIPKYFDIQKVEQKQCKVEKWMKYSRKKGLVRLK